eukprot:4731682-Pyramimonas_sp.AAC.1
MAAPVAEPTPSCACASASTSRTRLASRLGCCSGRTNEGGARPFAYGAAGHVPDRRLRRRVPPRSP